MYQVKSNPLAPENGPEVMGLGLETLRFKKQFPLLPPSKITVKLVSNVAPRQVTGFCGWFQRVQWSMHSLMLEAFVTEISLSSWDTNLPKSTLQRYL